MWPDIEFCQASWESAESYTFLYKLWLSKCPSYITLHHGNLQWCSFHLVPNNMGFYHGQILIETETDSLILLWTAHPNSFCYTHIRKSPNSQAGKRLSQNFHVNFVYVILSCWNLEEENMCIVCVAMNTAFYAGNVNEMWTTPDGTPHATAHC